MDIRTIPDHAMSMWHLVLLERNHQFSRWWWGLMQLLQMTLMLTTHVRSYWLKNVMFKLGFLGQHEPKITQQHLHTRIRNYCRQIIQNTECLGWYKTLLACLLAKQNSNPISFESLLGEVYIYWFPIWHYTFEGPNWFEECLLKGVDCASHSKP
jgi:hypothetical protein